MLDYIRRMQVSGSRSLLGRSRFDGSRAEKRRASRWNGGFDALERRELLSTTQNFDGTGQTSYSLRQIGGPPAALITPGGPTGNFLRLATTPTNPITGNNNSISFATSDPGTYSQVVAGWDFRVTQTVPGQSGVGMSFALLNTANYGTSGQAASIAPQQGIYDGSLAYGFDTTTNVVYVSLNGAIVSAEDISSQLNLASGQFIHAQSTIDFVNSTVTLVLTPSVSGSPVTVFNSLEIPDLAPYQSRVGYQAQSSATAFANFDLDNVNVQFEGRRLAGTISFGSSVYVANENQGYVQISIIRTGGSAGSATVSFTSADGTARNGVNYIAVAGVVTFGEGETLKSVILPVLDDRVATGDLTVNLFLGNPTFTAPLTQPIVSTLTIRNTDPVPPTVSPTVGLVPGRGRRVTAFRLSFSQPMDPATAQNVNNYQVLLVANRRNQVITRPVQISQAVVDPSGLFVTLYRADLGRMHLTKIVQILVNGSTATGLRNTDGTLLAGTNGVSGTDATLTVRS